MKKTLFTLSTALVAIPVHAAPLSSSDWTDKDNAPEGTYTFEENGHLRISGNAAGHPLLYNGESYQMQDGSRFSVTLHFDTQTFLDDAHCQLSIILCKDGFTSNTNDINNNHHDAVAVLNNEGRINIYSSNFDRYIETTAVTTQLTLTYIKEGNHLQYSLILNGEQIVQDNTKESDISGAWLPAFIASSETAVFTVTDATFTVSVPEPTTATLSLLALGALAARRRRL